MAVLTISYDASAGSDTLASGSGPAAAVTGSSATNGVGAVVNLDGSPDLSGVAVDSVLFAASASGLRHLSRILAVDNTAKTVTTEDTLTLGVGVLWAIGGTRKTLEYDNTMNDVNQGKAGWTFSLASGNYPMAGNGSHIFTPVAGTLADGPVSVVAKAGAATKPVISWVNDFALIYTSTTSAQLTLGSLELKNATSINAGANAIFSAAYMSTIRLVGCSVQCYGNGIYMPSDNAVEVLDTDIRSTGNSGIYALNVGRLIVSSCKIHDCLGVGIWIGSSSPYISVRILGTIINNNGNSGILVNGSNYAQNVTVSSCAIVNNANTGMRFDADNVQSYFSIRNTIFAGNIGYGLMPAPTSQVHADFNAYYNNTSGSYNNITAGPNDVALTADPFTDAAGGDFTLNNAAGGGALLRGTGLGYAGP